jgi:hypothetical protein
MCALIILLISDDFFCTEEESSDNSNLFSCRIRNDVPLVLPCLKGYIFLEKGCFALYICVGVPSVDSVANSFLPRKFRQRVLHL